ncbi:heme-thiolate peroxidase [Pleurotus djamor]|nr:heme-thiolate peroxidase [Pleurotus djamor]
MSNSRVVLISLLFCLIAAGPFLVRSHSSQIPLSIEQANSWTDAHTFIPRGHGDDRSSCPALNALANHGYLPHNGRGISHSDLFNGLRDGLGITFPLASLLTFGTYALLRQVPPLSLTDISRVHGVEHNCSLVHDDVPKDGEYPTSMPNLCLLDKLLEDSQNKLTLAVEDIARARIRREASPEYKVNNITLDALHAEIARGEMALVLDILGDGNEIPLATLRNFFQEERLPENWEPKHPQGLVRTARLARRIKSLMDSIRTTAL